MQCILYKIYFWKGFSYALQIDMHFICAPMLTKFYSCKNVGVTNLPPLEESHPEIQEALGNSLG
jgi:hypothetical protein